MNGTMDFDSLFASKFLSDIIVHCGSEVFPAHRAILAGGSRVFSTMLTSDMDEVKSGGINVTDMTAPTLKTIMCYMYTGKVKVDKLDADSLLEIIHEAEKYGLEELKNYCFRKLATCITDENVGALAVAVHLYRAEASVKAALEKFIQP